ncbi:MAG: dTDP-4-dehydrorhamnose reductase [Candidatus Margulisbacteria bacterium]|jgi:dTDP-4-dehydrorhamnose reductase|nr:dTDP-4-dehydrorhamnose reductase [Candidatus Margulisiibacteriota bacterium]
MKLAVIGADGQLGTDLMKLAPQAVGLTVADLDITDEAKSRVVLGQIKPAVVINTAAYNRVDDCEEKKELAYAVNAAGAGNIARICKELNAALVHLSTDYVFAGTKKTPYKETDNPDPTTVYGASKLAGEKEVSSTLSQHYIIRTSALFGTAGCLGKGGTNFVDVMVKKAQEGKLIKVVADEIVGPTYARDLAAKILQLIEQPEYGLYHVTNAGQCSWYEFAREILRLISSKTPLEPVSGTEFQAKAKRPAYSVLAHDHLKQLGLDDLRSWQDALKAYLQEKACLK